MDPTTSARAFYRAARVPGFPAPYDTLLLKVTYPACAQGTALERNTGVIPADPALAPFPVVIFLPGVNVGPECYQWLASGLAEKGVVTVTFAWVAEEIPGYISLTPGFDLARVRPGAYGSGPTCPAIQPIMDEISAMAAGPTPLQGLLDLEHLVLGGHSAGGTMALQNANRAWFPQLRAAFSFAAHSAASTMLGYPPGTFLPLSGDIPLLLLGGQRDGVIEASSQRYGMPASASGPLERTFDQAIPAGKAPAALVLLDHANHFTFAHPFDSTTGRHFLDHPASEDDAALRALSLEVVWAFLADPIRLDQLRRIGTRPGFPGSLAYKNQS